MSSFKNITQQPYKIGTLDINIVVKALKAKKQTILGLNKSQRNNVIVKYFNDLINNRIVIGRLYVTKEEKEIFSEDDCLLHMLLNFSGDKADVSYDLIEKCFVTPKKGGQENPIHFVPVDSMLDNSYFFKHFGTWLENGVTEEDINIAGEIAGRLQNTLIISVCNQDMDEKQFKNNFLNKI